MWLYRQTETPAESPPNGLFTVGFYDPEGKWEPESDHHDAEAAAERVRYLNGGHVAAAEADR